MEGRFILLKVTFDISSQENDPLAHLSHLPLIMSIITMIADENMTMASPIIAAEEFAGKGNFMFLRHGLI